MFFILFYLIFDLFLKENNYFSPTKTAIQNGIMFKIYLINSLLIIRCYPAKIYIWNSFCGNQLFPFGPYYGSKKTRGSKENFNLKLLFAIMDKKTKSCLKK